MSKRVDADASNTITIRTRKELIERQALPLEAKVLLTEQRIHEWQCNRQLGVNRGVISFSGGKDSTVLLHIARRLYPDIPATFSNTGLEYPEIQKFVRSFDNVAIVRPKMRFDEVLSTYGYPLISKEVAEAIYYARRIRNDVTATTEKKRNEFSKVIREDALYKDWRRNCLTNATEQFGDRSRFNKAKYLPIARDIPVLISHYCCKIMKKDPLYEFQKRNRLYPVLATMADESRLRLQSWIRTGCNAFNGKAPKSQPMMFWTEQDVLQYIVKNGIEIASVYGDIVCEDADGFVYPASGLLVPGSKLKCTECQRTGCVYCAFGFHNDKGKTRFQRLAETHPRQYEYCMGGGQWVDNPAYDLTAPEYDGKWKNWNPKKIWVPSKKGLGFKKVFDLVNDIYGKDFYRYE